MSTDVVRLQAARREMTALAKEYNQITKTLDKTGTTMRKISREFTSGVGQMQQDLLKLKNELSQINKASTPTRFEIFSNMINKLDTVKQQVVSIGSELANLSLGTSIGGVIDEAKAAAIERGHYAAKGKTEEEMRHFDDFTKQITSINPYLNQSQAMGLISKSEQVNPKYAEKYAEKAAMLSVSTKYSPEEHLKMMAAMRQKTGIDDPTRLANSIQYMSNNAGALNGKFVDAIVEFSAQNSKFLDTPEKMATMVGEIGKLGIWSDDKAFTALRESTLKFTDRGELTNLLKAQYEAQGKGKAEAQSMADSEAQKINLALSSGDKNEERIAIGKLMMSVATIQDKAAQQKVLQNLGGNAGKELGNDFTKLLEMAGKISTGDIRPKVGNEAEKAYQAATQANPFFETIQAQRMAKNEMMEATSTISSELSTFSVLISNTVAGLTRWFNTLSDGTKQATVYTGAAIAAGVTLTIKLTRLAVAVKDLFGRRKKGTNVNVGGPLSKDKENVICCCCCGGQPDFKRKKKTDPSTGKKEADGKSKKTAVPGKNTSPVPPAGNEPGPNAGGGDGNSGKNGKGSWKKALKTGLKRLPLIGSILGLATIAGSENKLETAAQVGAESLGGWGGAAAGAAAGAAIGSVVPVLGTAIGGVIGGLIGGFGGSMAGSAAFDGIKSLWQDEPPTTVAMPRRPLSKEMKQNLLQGMPAGPPVPDQSPVSGHQAKSQPISLTIPQITIPLHAEGVLQDIPTMLRMLSDPSVGQTIKNIIEKSLLDALETRGGVTV